MKKVFLTAAMIVALLRGQAQKDSTGFGSRKLKVEEVNLVSSYYTQTGNHAAVTGGIGTQKLNDIANVFDIKLVGYDKKYRKHTLTGELGIDHYTSASSDMIDLKANSSASYADTRYYPSLGWTMENEAKGTTIGAGLSLSKEFDYLSRGANISFAKKTADKSGEFSAKFQTYLDQVSLILPVELRTVSTGRDYNYPTTPRNTFAGSLSYSQIINQNLQVMFLADAVKQQGYLSLPFHRVYFRDGSVRQENLPSSRFKLPLGFRANYFLGDRFILKAYYRYYKDDWGVKSNTAELEVPVKVSPFVSVSPFYRYYTQTANNYFAPYETHTLQDLSYTSNYDGSAFHSGFLGANLRITPPKGVMGMSNFNAIELRYGHYTRTDGLASNIISMNLKFK